MEYMGQKQGRQEEIHHPTHRFQCLFLDLLLMGWRRCASNMGVIKTNFHPAVLVQNPLRNQFIHYYITSRGFFCINHIRIHNFVVVAMECFFATVDRGSIMARIHWWSVMVYGSLQAKFLETKYNGHIHRYGTPIKIVVYISKAINNNNKIFWRL